MNRQLLEDIKKYIEERERIMMWEYSSNIVDNEELYQDRKRMPDIYFQVIELLK